MKTRTSFLQIVLLGLGVVVGTIAGLFVVTVPLELYAQTVFAVVTIGVLLAFAKVPGRQITVFLIVLSLLVSTRYVYWRTTETLHFDTLLGWIAGIALYLAEAYAWLVLIFGYVQTVWPLERPIRSLREDPAEWPTVDIYIPTYNESLMIVRDTVLAALNIDYPRDKMKVYLLDDGRREEFRQFAAEAGVGYIIRADNAHAKAGNLNHALRLTDGELICIFDCDHVATRAFLQLTVGYFIDNPKLALIQTPHHFYSPDPFERNLASGRSIPNEGELFYGPVQMGNDFWNAAFFCGSCAVIRRSALEDIGGFAVETVTEDAHTALKLQKRGWDSCYLNVKLAAGLATERLALHIAQRMRWARGMTQILRRDNPLVGGKLSLFQRFCYLNAMLHFQFAIPRIVFLAAPLVYLLFQENVIHASAWAIVAYALPHLVHAVMTNRRIQGTQRGTFWGEIYETVLSFHLARITISTFLNPKAGKFNVTEKGGLLPNDYFDFRIMRPHIVMSILLVLGCVFGISKLLFPGTFHVDPAVLALNVFWALFNLVTVLCAIAVGKEARQIRSTVRLDLELPAVLLLENGHTFRVTTKNMSMGGLSAELPDDVHADLSLVTDVELPCGNGVGIFPVKVVRASDRTVNLKFDAMPLHVRRELVKAILGRADSWLSRGTQLSPGFIHSVLAIIVAIAGLLRWSRDNAARRPAARRSAGRKAAPPAPGATEQTTVSSTGAAAGQTVPLAAEPRFKVSNMPARSKLPFLKSRRRGISTGLSVLVFGTALLAASCFPSPFGRAAAQEAAPAPAAPAAPVPSPAVPAPAPAEAPAQNPAPAPAETPAAPLTNAGGLPADPDLTRNIVATFKDMGAINPIRLISVHGESWLPFSLRRDEVVTSAKLTLTFGYSPSLIPELSHLAVFMNGELLGTIELTKERSGGVTVEFPVNPALFLPENRINLQFIAHYTRQCEDPLHSTLWGVVNNTNSMMELTVQRLPQQDDLSHLPAPFFDRGDMRPLTLPFVMAAQPSNDVLKAAGAVAAYFGTQASYRGFSFPLASGELPHSDVVVVATSQDAIPGITLPELTGPTLAVVPNPVSPSRKLLLVLGRNGEELRNAADTLALGAKALTGASAVVGPPQLAARKPYDADRWIPTDRPVRLGELSDPLSLQGVGLLTGYLTSNFNSAPDLFSWGADGIPLDVKYRYPNGTWLESDLSRLDVGLNGKFLRALPTRGATPEDELRGLVVDNNYVMSEGHVAVPPYLLFGRNQVQFLFDLKSNKKGECTGYLPDEVRSAIDPDSTIDLTGMHHFAEFPNLGFFASVGFPFTRLADLSQTALVMAPQPSVSEIETYLVLMGRVADSTGVPPTGLTILRAGEKTDTIRDKDILVLGTPAIGPQISPLLEGGPFRLEGDNLRIEARSPVDHFFAMVGKGDQERQRAAASSLLIQSNAFSGMFSYRSPLNDDRVVVALMSVDPARMPAMAAGLADPVQNNRVGGDLVIDSADGFTSFSVGDTFWLGKLPAVAQARWFLSNRPILMIVILLAAVFLISLPIYLILRSIARRRLRGREG